MTTMIKEPVQSVFMRIKQANYDWLKAQAEIEERSVTWIVNKRIEECRKGEEKLEMSMVNPSLDSHSQEVAQ